MTLSENNVEKRTLKLIQRRFKVEFIERDCSWSLFCPDDTNTNSWTFTALREQTELDYDSFSTKFYHKRFIPTKCMQYIPADIHFNICSHYVSPSILSLWLWVWKASWIYIFQIYEQSRQSFISCRIDDGKEEREKEMKRKRDKEEVTRTWNLVPCWRNSRSAARCSMGHEKLGRLWRGTEERRGAELIFFGLSGSPL